jgi:hypothetical protein
MPARQRSANIIEEKIIICLTHQSSGQQHRLSARCAGIGLLELLQSSLDFKGLLAMLSFSLPTPKK